MQPRLSFDTSAVNALADNPDCMPLLAGIQAGYFTRLTFPSVTEPLSSSDAARRDKLFDILNVLRRNGECLEAHGSILTELARNHQKFGSSKWDSLNIRFIQCETEVARKAFTNKESSEERQAAQKYEEEFTRVFTNAGPHFRKIFEDGMTRPSNADELLAHLHGAGGVFWVMAADLYERATSIRLTEEQIRLFADDCPPFFALMLTLVHAQFEWAEIRANPIKKRKRVGRQDLFCAIYLPYCDLYVTDDDEQRRCLQEIAVTAKLSVDVISFTDFSSRLMPLSCILENQRVLSSYV
jgi:hypothetical protein